ncbi:MAG: glycine--tRNA ligase [Halobaculum sp.]
MADPERVTELAKRRGFYFGSVGAYGGVAGLQTYGPRGAALKDAVESAWRDRFTVKEGSYEVEAPTVMPKPVFDASGHTDDFDDMLVECGECGSAHRADHLIEDNTAIEEAESLPHDEVEALIADEGIACPTCGAPLAGQSVEGFNLMFQTNIGPGSGQPGFLRPETAQGIFVEFPRLKEYARNQLPFGVTQIGRGYRNEISPRGGLKRLREFNMAELEQFVHPEGSGPNLEPVADVRLPLYAAPAQEAGEGVTTYTVREAVAEGVIASEWIAYFLGRALRWYDRVGIDTDRLRFRQHNSGELAHYASDCWDAEALLGAEPAVGGKADHSADGEADDQPADSADGEDDSQTAWQGGDWVEIAGFADRGDYDLSKHAAATDDTFSVFEEYDEPRTVERPTVDPDMATLGPEYGDRAGAVRDALESLAARDPDAFDGEEVTVTVGGEEITVATDVAGFERETVTETGERITPHVIEPSFGVDRTVLALVDHAYRRDTVDGERRTFLALDPEVAPRDAAVFPLVSNDDRLTALAGELEADLRAAGLSVSYDDSGSIGRRYRRQDEIGTPFCVTVDRDGVESDGPDTVTLRERNTAAQVRLPASELPETVAALVEPATDRTFDDLLAAHEVVEPAD